MMATEAIELIKLAQEKIELGNQLQERLSNYEKVDGVLRTKRNINREINFLKKVMSNGTLNKLHVRCSNLAYFALLVDTLEHQSGNVGLNAMVFSNQRETPLRLDIICENGKKWIKVIARNTKYPDIALMNSATGGRIIRKANEYVSFAKKCLFMFEPPAVVFQFGHDIDEKFKAILESCGVKVSTTLINTNNEPINCSDITTGINKLNIDVTALLAYISALTNGCNEWEFVEPILNQQSEWEVQNPVKPVLEELFQGKRLICCKSALNSFQEIVSVVAGPSEKLRADELIKRLEIYEDIDDIPEDLLPLKMHSKITTRSLKIFAFGVQMKAVTVTANQAFIRSAKMKGVNVPVFIIQARALTESKQTTATQVAAL